MGVIDQHTTFLCGCASLAEALESRGYRPPDISNDDWLSDVALAVHGHLENLYSYDPDQYTTADQIIRGAAQYGAQATRLWTSAGVRQSLERGESVIVLVAMQYLEAGEDFAHWMWCLGYRPARDGEPAGEVADLVDSFYKYDKTANDGRLTVSVSDLETAMDKAPSGPYGVAVVS